MSQLTLPQKERALNGDLAERCLPFPGSQSLNTFIISSPLAIITLDLEGLVTGWNPASERIFGWSTQESLGRPLLMVYPEKQFEHNSFCKRLNSGESISGIEITRHRKDGAEIVLRASMNPLREEDGTIIGNMALLEDVTEQTRQETRIRKLSQIVEQCPISVVITDIHGIIEYANPKFTSLTGYTTAESIGQNPRILKTGATSDAEYRDLWETITSGRDWKGEFLNRKKNGELYRERATICPLTDNSGKITGYVALKEDITDQRNVEEQLAEANQAIEAIIQAAPLAIYHLAPSGEVSRWNHAAETMFGWKSKDVIGKRLPTLAKDDSDTLDENLVRTLAGECEKGMETRRYKRTGEAVDVHLWTAPTEDANGNATGIISIMDDITERKHAQNQLQLQLERIASLRQIDMAITSSLDLQLTLNVLLDQVTRMLGATAADILLYNPHTYTLEYAARRGQASNELTRPIHLGDDGPGMAARQRRLISLSELTPNLGSYQRAMELAGKGDISYYAVPLIARGQVKGVMEVYHLDNLQRDSEWLDFLEMLAGQAAIAIDSITLFEDLQRTNSELAMAYDATIEGWSRALDLRDKETEGHSERVTEVTMQLARIMGINEAEVAHIRRGALLHDIGKMGVPDSILLKPGSLNEEEWDVMRRHPMMAYDLLAPIAFLRPSLEIPYAHHEKWDGSGYPRGLKGQSIPLAARIFAIADIWDALSSDRPYRAAWPQVKVLAHIQSLAGNHLDPDVVTAFLGLARIKLAA